MSRVVVAMSGGVDSSTTAALLKERGHEVIGVHMKLLNGADAESESTCCGFDDALDARQVAATLEIPFYVINLVEEFKKAVIDDLVSSYTAGLTPNPCILCNGVLKFDVLLKRALSLGADYLATGHYARIGPGPTLMMAKDTAKDQTYFLFPITPSALSRTMFPLGEFTKPEVRALAEKYALPTAQKKESQDICFLPKDNHAQFIDAQRPDLNGAGVIATESGDVVGRHQGFYRYTIGQRRGLGVAMGKPSYVTDIDPQTNRVTIGDNDALMHIGLEATNWVWYRRPAIDEAISVRVRHRGTLVDGFVGEGDPCRVHFCDPIRAVAPGQAVVIYSHDTVLGGGWITRSIKRERG